MTDWQTDLVLLVAVVALVAWGPYATVRAAEPCPMGAPITCDRDAFLWNDVDKEIERDTERTRSGGWDDPPSHFGNPDYGGHFSGTEDGVKLTEPDGGLPDRLDPLFYDNDPGPAGR